MDLRVSSPCPESWARMKGDDRVRFCGRCNLNVYNLTVMKPHEIETLVRRTNGRLCGRLYVRVDRTATVRDCGGSRARKMVRRAVALGVFLVLGAFAWLLRGVIAEPDRSMHPQWVRKALNWIEPEQPRGGGKTMGIVCPPPKPSPPPPPPPSAP
jgi:hypothetical protein